MKPGRQMTEQTFGLLQRLCKRWGGKIVLLSSYQAYEAEVVSRVWHQRRMHDQGLGPLTSQAPAAQWHGLCWETRTIYAVEEHANAGSIIHEMGHTFLDDFEGQVESSDELNWLGWEIQVARYARCYKIWSDQNSGYVLGDLFDGIYDWGGQTRTEERMIVEDRIQYVREIGYLDRRFRPLSMRD